MFIAATISASKRAVSSGCRLSCFAAVALKKIPGGACATGIQPEELTESRVDGQ